MGEREEPTGSPTGGTARESASSPSRTDASGRRVSVLRLLGTDRPWRDLFEPRLVSWMGGEFKFVGYERDNRAWVLQGGTASCYSSPSVTSGVNVGRTRGTDPACDLGVVPRSRSRELIYVLDLRGCARDN